MSILHILASIIVFIFVPVSLGLPWVHCSIMTNKPHGEKLLFIYALGWQEAFAIFHIISVITTFSRVQFSLSCTIYLIVIGIIIAVSIFIYIIENKKKDISLRRNIHTGVLEITNSIRNNSIYTWIYIIGFYALLGFQLYHTLNDEVGYWSWDDAAYVVYATDTLKNNLALLTAPYTGMYEIPYTASWVQRAFQSIHFYYAFLSLVTGLDVATVVHTLMYSGIVVLCYLVYGLLAYRLFHKKEDRYIFLIFVSIVFLFGYTSQYSLTFRFLGPNWQGKALLAILISPMLLYILLHTIEEQHRISSGIIIFTVSTAASGMTLGGVYTIIALMVSFVLIGVIRSKNASQLLYLIWGGIAPGILAGIYLYVRFLK